MYAPQEFTVFGELEAFEKAGDDQPMRIGGIVSTAKLDKERERVLQEGLDFKPFLTSGFFNDNHSKSSADVVGYPTDAYFVRKGDRLPNGRLAKANGWWAEGYLLNTDKGRALWSLTKALSGAPRKLAFSIQGNVTERDEFDPTKVVKATVKHIAVTHCPMNTDTELHALSKALMAGSAISNPGASPGEGFALRAESLEGSPNDTPSSQVSHIAEAPADDASNGGFAGVDPHAKRAKKAAADSDDDIVKSVDRDFQVIDELSELQRWIPHFAEQRERIEKSEPLTKSEARTIVAKRLPHLSADQVEAFVNNLTK